MYSLGLVILSFLLSAMHQMRVRLDFRNVRLGIMTCTQNCLYLKHAGEAEAD